MAKRIAKMFTCSLLCFVMLFSIVAPTFVYARTYDQDNETQNNIRGEVIDFSNLEEFKFETNTSYAEASYSNDYGYNGSYTIEKVGHDYTITLRNLTAKKIILPYDDADEGKPNYNAKKERQTHIKIVLEGSNHVTGYGISGGYTKGVTITGSGSLYINAYQEKVTEKFLDMKDVTDAQREDPDFKAKPEDYKEESNSYIVPGIVLETDAITDSDSRAGFIIEATGQITINSPYYWGIICNGDIKFKEGSHVKITADPAGKKLAESGAISADRIIKEDGSDFKVESGKILEFKKVEPTKQKIEDNTPPVITGEGIEEGGTYCENPIITVEDDKEIVNITVNRIGITKFIENTWTKKTFAIPTYMDDVKTIVATDSSGNRTTFKFTSHNGHITYNGTEIDRKEPTCTEDGYHKVQYDCKICGTLVRTDTIVDQALGHRFSDWETSKTEKHRSCTVCGYTESENLPVEVPVKSTTNSEAKASTASSNKSSSTTTNSSSSKAPSTTTQTPSVATKSTTSSSTTTNSAKTSATTEKKTNTQTPKVSTNNTVVPKDAYVGNINSELKEMSLGKANNAAYVKGEIVVVEWVNGKSTVPSKKPTMRFKSTDGEVNMEVFVTPTGTNTYYFDRFIEGINTDKQYYFEVASGDSRNISTSKSMNVYFTNAKYNNKIIGKYSDKNIKLSGQKIVFEKDIYVGNINSELKEISLGNANNAAYVKGEIVVVEWVNGKSTVPSKKPTMRFRSTDGEVNIEVFVTPTGTNTYYFDRFIEGIDTSKQYYFEVASGDSRNVSTSKSMNVYFTKTKYNNKTIGKYHNKNISLSGQKISIR